MFCSHHPHSYTSYDIDPYQLQRIRAEQRRRQQIAELQRQREQAENDHRRQRAAEADFYARQLKHQQREEALRSRYANSDNGDIAELLGYDFFGRPVYRRRAPVIAPAQKITRIPVRYEEEIEPNQAQSGSMLGSDEVVYDTASGKKPQREIAENKEDSIRFHDDEAVAKAARAIQRAWRRSSSIRKGLRRLEPISQAFEEMVALMAFPASPVFDEKMQFAYNSINTPVLYYVDRLEKLLLRLDSIDSNGIPEVKQARKLLVKAIEAELERVEKWKATAAEAQKAESSSSDVSNSVAANEETDVFRASHSSVVADSEASNVDGQFDTVAGSHAENNSAGNAIVQDNIVDASPSEESIEEKTEQAKPAVADIETGAENEDYVML